MRSPFESAAAAVVKFRGNRRVYKIAACSLFFFGGWIAAAPPSEGGGTPYLAAPMPDGPAVPPVVTGTPLTPPFNNRLPAPTKSEKPSANILPAPLSILPPPRPVPPSFNLAPTPTPDDVEALRREMNELRLAREALHKERTSIAPSDAGKPEDAGNRGDVESSVQLRLRLAEMMAKLREARANAQNKPATGTSSTTQVAPPAKGPSETPRAMPGEGASSDRSADSRHGDATDGPVDGAGLGRALFLSGDFKGALSAYEALETTEQQPEDRLLTQYMIASCQRKLGKIEDATARYREIANSGGSETLVKNAQWHLQGIKARQDLLAELESVRARREALLRRVP